MKMTRWIAIVLAGWLLIPAPAARAGTESETAELLVKLLQVGRGVISEHQDLINDPSKGAKGFTADYFGQRTIQKFRESTGLDLTRPPATQQQRLLRNLLEAGQEVVDEAQPVINKQGVAFKGFIPAAWGRKTGEKFTMRTGIRLKLTAHEYRYPGNKPDEFETEVLKIFSSGGYPVGKGYSQVRVENGVPVLRYMAPEYAGRACLSCHGDPKGTRDDTGFKREGFKEGDVMGAISLALPLRTEEAVPAQSTPRNAGSKKKGGL